MWLEMQNWMVLFPATGRIFPCITSAPFFRITKQTSENIAGTTFK